MFKNSNRGFLKLLATGIIAVLVVVVGGGILIYQYYYIPKQEVKISGSEVLENKDNYEKIATDLMQNYLNQYKSVNVVENKKLVSYKINKIDVGSFDDKDQCFRFTVDFSVKTTIKPVEGNMVKSDWVAGNGSMGNDNWINNKSLVFSVLKQNDIYKLIDAGTGSGGGSCAIPGKYFSAVLKETDILKDETSNWKIYRNTEYGFEIKYPQDWKVAKNVLNFEPDLVFCPNILATNPDPEVICKIREGGANTPKPTYEDGMIYLFAYGTNPEPNNSNYHYLGFGGTIPKYYYLFSEGNETEVNQMLSTFRFLK